LTFSLFFVFSFSSPARFQGTQFFFFFSREETKTGLYRPSFTAPPALSAATGETLALPRVLIGEEVGSIAPPRLVAFLPLPSFLLRFLSHRSATTSHDAAQGQAEEGTGCRQTEGQSQGEVEMEEKERPLLRERREPSLFLAIDGFDVERRRRRSIDKRLSHPVLSLFLPSLPQNPDHIHKQTVEDKTFGLKNKNKSSKVQR
jgi:hypothetical protein